MEERHRHRWEVNPDLVGEIEKHGMMFVGQDEEGERMEIMELKGKCTLYWGFLFWKRFDNTNISFCGNFVNKCTHLGVPNAELSLSKRMLLVRNHIFMYLVLFRDVTLQGKPYLQVFHFTMKNWTLTRAFKCAGKKYWKGGEQLATSLWTSL